MSASPPPDPTTRRFNPAAAKLLAADDAESAGNAAGKVSRLTAARLRSYMHRVQYAWRRLRNDCYLRLFLALFFAGANLLSAAEVVFQDGTDMSQAMGEVVGYVNRSRAFMPPQAVSTDWLSSTGSVVRISRLTTTKLADRLCSRLMEQAVA